VSVTSELSERIVATGPAELGAATRRAAQRLVIDGLAVGVAGSREAAIQLLVDHHLAVGSSTQTTVLGHGVRLGIVAAAGVNGAAMHVLDYEPMWSPANHAVSTTLPVVMALADVLDVSGDEVLTALVKGIEIQGWIRYASRQWEAGELLFHPPGVVGPIGAAVAAGHLLALDAGKLRHAMGIAASRSGGLMANVGTMTKSLHCGGAAAAGLEAALLAGRGFTANPDIFDAARGFPAAFSPHFVPADLAGFGPPFRMVDPGYALKLFPCQYGTHFGIRAGLAARQAIPDPAEIRSVRLTAPVMGYVDRPRPSTGLDGKFSLQYTLAAALLDGSVGLDTFTDERLTRADMQGLLTRIELIADPSIPGRFEDMHVLVDVEARDGTSVRERCDGPRGMWGAPEVPDSEHSAKVVDCLGRVLGPSAVDQVVELADRFASLTNVELRHLNELTGQAASTA